MRSDLLCITEEPIDIAGVYGALSDPECGAQLVFVGSVRNENGGRKVSAVTYDVFKELAERAIKALAQEVRDTVSTPLRLVILHRVGTLKVGEISTVIGVATAHRAESYEASRYLIEQLKIRVPIWKEEHYVDGDSAWLEGADLVAENSGCGPGRR